MARANLIAFCLVFIGAYGVLYAIHAGRAVTDPIYDFESRIDDNESQVSDLENEIEEVKSIIKDLEYRKY
ncbi:hypothetical protein [Thiohalobacter sp. COW1]|uniref:hypothetical protein n=1 Tax=Thiohalobacter sp. COW1 TaxID=2795687 RepID=UPI001916431B|nr:hypothetical protein [Thiohalobacter sp. COW1]